MLGGGVSMALVERIEETKMERNLVHGEVSRTFSPFRAEDGKKYVQLDTYGSPTRKFRGKKSQSIQLGSEAAREPIAILKREFGLN
jgi:hypothetical protein